jgi:hypothetical protein
VSFEPSLVIEVPSGGALERQLNAGALEAIASGEAVVQPGPTDARGNLEAPAAGQVVLSVPSPEALRRQADEVAAVIERAGSGVEPLLVEVEVAEELRQDELAPLLDAVRHARRAVILRVVREG